MSSRNRFILTVLALCAAGATIAYWQDRVWRSTGPARTPAAPFSIGVVNGTKTLVPPTELIATGPAADAMPAIDQPDFASVAAADQYLKDDGLGIDVATGGKRRFYPFQILVWHLAVNDSINGKPVLVAFCPLCQDGGVYDRTANGTVLRFGTAGQAWNSTSLLYDKGTNTRWTAASALAINGPLAGVRLAPLPSRVMPWSAWKAAYPDGLVLARVAGSERDYTRDPYGSYSVDHNVLFPLNRPDSRRGVKEIVLGLSAGGTDRAYPVADLAQAGTIDETLGTTPVTVWSTTGKSAVAFDRRTGGKTLTFFRSKDGSLVDHETGSSWNADGAAVSGQLRGSKLAPLPLERAFWFCWAGLHPGTSLYTLP